MCAMFRLCTGQHKTPLKDVANRPISSMNGTIVACFYFDHILNVAAGSNTFIFIGAGWGQPSPQEKEETHEEEN